MNTGGYSDIKLSKYIIFLAMLSVVVTLVPSVMLYRLIDIDNFVMPGGMLIFPLIYVLTDIVAEVYGYKIARSFIWLSIISNFIFAILVFSVIYIPTSSQSMAVSNEYSGVFHGIVRSDVANCIGVVASRFINAYLISKWKILTFGRFFIFRSFAATIIGDVIMLLFWAPIAFIGVVSFKQMMAITLADFLVRAIYAAVGTIPAYYVVQYLKPTFLDSRNNFLELNP
jgi:uncharacterized integral membrane protein (TIGR00697 family)